MSGFWALIIIYAIAYWTGHALQGWWLVLWWLLFIIDLLFSDDSELQRIKNIEQIVERIRQEQINDKD